MVTLSTDYILWRKAKIISAAAAAKSLQSCPILCDPIDSSPPGSTAPGILQVRTLEWVATSFSNAWKWKMKVKLHSRVRLFTTPWTAAFQAPPSMGFSRQEYWSGVPLPSPCKPHILPKKENLYTLGWQIYLSFLFKSLIKSSLAGHLESLMFSQNLGNLRLQSSGLIGRRYRKYFP